MTDRRQPATTGAVARNAILGESWIAALARLSPGRMLRQLGTDAPASPDPLHALSGHER
jgi:hypothetical protein